MIRLGFNTLLVLLFDVEKVSIDLSVGAEERTMRQIGGSNFGAGQVFDVLEIEIVRAVIKHMDHFVGENSLYVMSTNIVLTNNDLVGLWIVASGHRAVALFARNVPSNVNRASSKLRSAISFSELTSFQINVFTYHPDARNARIMSFTNGLFFIHL